MKVPLEPPAPPLIEVPRRHAGVVVFGRGEREFAAALSDALGALGYSHTRLGASVRHREGAHVSRDGSTVSLSSHPDAFEAALAPLLDEHEMPLVAYGVPLAAAIEPDLRIWLAEVTPRFSALPPAARDAARAAGLVVHGSRPDLPAALAAALAATETTSPKTTGPETTRLEATGAGEA